MYELHSITVWLPDGTEHHYDTPFLPRKGDAIAVGDDCFIVDRISWKIDIYDASDRQEDELIPHVHLIRQAQV